MSLLPHVLKNKAQAENNALATELKKLQEANGALLAENEALKAEIELLKGGAPPPVTENADGSPINQHVT